MSFLCLRTRVQKSINNNFSLCKFKIIFKSSTRLANFFTFKDKIPLCLHSINYVYKFVCGRCNATYYNKSCCHSKMKVSEHSGIPSLTNKWSKSMKVTALEDHMLVCNHVVSFDDFRVLASSNSEFHLRSRKHPILNKNKASLPLNLFDSPVSFGYLVLSAFIDCSLFIFYCSQ